MIGENLKTLRNGGRLFAWILSVCLCAAIIYFLRNDYEKVLQIISIGPFQLFLLSVICASLFFPPGISRKLMAERLDIRLAFVDWYGLLMVSNLIGLIVPARGDLAVSAIYLRKKYNLPVTHFVSMVYGSGVLLALCLSISGAICLIFVAAEGIWLNVRVLGVVVAIGILSLFLGWLPSGLLRGENWVIERMRSALEGWKKLRADKALVTKLTFLSLSGITLFSLWMYSSYRMLGFEISFLAAIVVSVSILLSFFVSITPGNLGIREALLGLVSQVLGFGFTEGVAVTVLQRAVSLLVFLCVGGFFSIFIMRSLIQSLNGERVPSQKEP